MIIGTKWFLEANTFFVNLVTPEAVSLVDSIMNILFLMEKIKLFNNVHKDSLVQINWDNVFFMNLAFNFF